jgi:thioredoxin reductase (NADPH)
VNAVVEAAAGPEETPDRNGAFPRLGEDQVAELARIGTRRRVRAGEVLYEEGDPKSDLFVILSGLVAVVQRRGARERQLAVHGPGRFLGELSLLTGQPMFLTAVVRADGEVLAVPVQRLSEITAKDPSLADTLLRALLQRRRLQVEMGAGLHVVGSRYSPDTARIRAFLARNRIPHTFVDLEEDREAEALLRELRLQPNQTPVVIWLGRHVLRNPENDDIARLLGLKPAVQGQARYDLVVVGAGPAGLAAAVYASSEGLATLLLDSSATGGQAATSSSIENYLGFPAGVSGAELADRALVQAEKFGTDVSVPSEVVSLHGNGDEHVVAIGDDWAVSAVAVVLATGVRYRQLAVPGIEAVQAASVYYAATEIEANQCRGDHVVVVGGGNSAGQAAIFLSRFAPTVTLVVRGHDLAADMSRYLADRIAHHPRIGVCLHHEVVAVEGGPVLTAVVVNDIPTGTTRRIPARALFVFIGAQPHTSWLDGQLALDESGFIRTGTVVGSTRPLETSRAGVFAAGDVRSGSVKRVAAAVGEGATAVRLVHEHLSSLGAGAMDLPRRAV